MASLLSLFNPVPRFPEYTGPHKVGTVDVELPVSGLGSPSPAPEGAADIHTIQFRIFYPAAPDSQGKRITWLPAPQRLHVGAYAQFLGLGTTLSSMFSFLPRHLHYATIPVHKNAALLPVSNGRRWPTVIFSHGLGGNRNAYSHLAGSLASHGVVVICPEHRDGSAAVSLIRDPASRGQRPSNHTRRVVPYKSLPHAQDTAIWEARNAQLRIRLWEMGLLFEGILGLERGDKTLMNSNLNSSTPSSALAQFATKLDVKEPGKVIFSGHSFGAVTILQLLKSTYYASRPELSTMAKPLFTPSPTSGIRAQITAENPTILLDMWCFPLLAASTDPLYRVPLPCYDKKATPPAPGGRALLAVESAAFWKWTEHLEVKARLLSPDPAAKTVSPDLFALDRRPENDSKTEDETMATPHFFYAEESAHLNQSDFGVLFPWLTKRAFGCDEPERVLRLNVRAQLQFLRSCGVPVGPTSASDLVENVDVDAKAKEAKGPTTTDATSGGWIDDDPAILDPRGDRVRTWKYVNIIGMGGDAYPSELEWRETTTREQEAKAREGEREMQGEIEPSLSADAVKAAATEVEEGTRSGK